MSDPISSKYSYLVPIDFLNGAPASQQATAPGVKRTSLDELNALQKTGVNFRGIRNRSEEITAPYPPALSSQQQTAKVNKIIPVAATAVAAGGLGALLSAHGKSDGGTNAGMLWLSGGAGAGLALLAVAVGGALSIGYAGGFFDPPRDFRKQFELL